jgi:hypothetical protein
MFILIVSPIRDDVVLPERHRLGRATLHHFDVAWRGPAVEPSEWTHPDVFNSEHDK